jgi:hypothetical protein
LTEGGLPCGDARSGQALMTIVDARHAQHMRTEWPKGPLGIKSTQ